MLHGKKKEHRKTVSFSKNRKSTKEKRPASGKPLKEKKGESNRAKKGKKEA